MEVKKWKKKEKKDSFGTLKKFLGQSIGRDKVMEDSSQREK